MRTRAVRRGAQRRARDTRPGVGARGPDARSRGSSVPASAGTDRTRCSARRAGRGRVARRRRRPSARGSNRSGFPFAGCCSGRTAICRIARARLCQVRLGMPVGQVQADCRRLGQHQFAIHQHRNAPAWIELQVVGALVRGALAVDQHQFKGDAQFFQQPMRREVGVARVVVALIQWFFLFVVEEGCKCYADCFFNCRRRTLQCIKN